MKKTLEVINELKEKELIKDYAIGGAIATLRWTEPFFTRDLDIFVILFTEPNEKNLIILTPIYEYLKKKGYTNWDGHKIIIEGIPVDIFTADELEKKAIENAVETKYQGAKTKIMTPEYLIALFLRAGRDKDIRKIQMLLTQTKVDKTKLMRILNEFGLKKKFEEFRKKYEK